MEMITNDDKPELKAKKFLEAESRSYTKVFKTEDEAVAWRTAKVAELTAEGYTVFGGSDDPNDFMFFPTIEEFGDEWNAYIDAEKTVFEEPATEASQ